MPLFVKTVGVWTACTTQVKTRGVFKPPVAGFAKLGGIWRQYTSPPVTGWSLSSGSVNSRSTQGTAAISYIGFGPGGAIVYGSADEQITQTGPTSWLQGPAIEYWVKFIPTSGAATVNDAAFWAKLDTYHTITKRGNNGGGTVIYTVQIATDSSGLNIVVNSPNWRLDYIHAAP